MRQISDKDSPLLYHSIRIHRGGFIVHLVALTDFTVGNSQAGLKLLTKRPVSMSARA